jgi:hypothetical protein
MKISFHTQTLVLGTRDQKKNENEYIKFIISNTYGELAYHNNL